MFNYMGRRLRLEILYNFKEEELEQQKKYLDQKLEQIRWVDNLTGLYNREKYSSLLKDIETKKIRQIGIVDMDINGLRNINATKGLSVRRQNPDQDSGHLSKVFLALIHFVSAVMSLSVWH